MEDARRVDHIEGARLECRAVKIGLGSGKERRVFYAKRRIPRYLTEKRGTALEEHSRPARVVSILFAASSEAQPVNGHGQQVCTLCAILSYFDGRVL